MTVSLTAEQREFQDILRSFLSKHWPSGSVHQAIDGKGEREQEVWRRLTGELGVTAIAIPEQFGGLGLTQVDLSLVAETLGHALYTGPWFSTVALAANALLVVVDVPQADDTGSVSSLLAGIATGGTTATLAYENHQPRGEPPTSTVARRQGDQWVIEGIKDHVVDGSTAELLLVAAATGAGTSLFSVDRRDVMSCTDLESLDPTRRLARIEFSGTRARLLGIDGGFDLQHVLDLATLAAVAEAVGGSAACIETTVEHVLTREQFGRPIGSFQAVKHRLADMQVRLETCRSTLRYLTRSVETEPENFPLLVSVAKTWVTQSYFRTAADTIQLHGGIGFTWEHPSQLHFKRAKAQELMFGTHREHRARIADTVLGPVPA